MSPTALIYFDFAPFRRRAKSRQVIRENLSSDYFIFSAFVNEDNYVHLFSLDFFLYRITFRRGRISLYPQKF